MNMIFLLDNDMVYCRIKVFDLFFSNKKNIYHTFIVCAFTNYYKSSTWLNHRCKTCNLWVSMPWKPNLMSLYGPTFDQISINLCIVFQCKLYIYIYIYMYIYIYVCVFIYTTVLPLSDGRYFLSYFGYSTFFGCKLQLFRGRAIVIFLLHFGCTKSKSRKWL